MLNSYKEAERLVEAAYFSDKETPSFTLEDINNFLSTLDSRSVSMTISHAVNGKAIYMVAHDYNVPTCNASKVITGCLRSIHIAGRYAWFGSDFKIELEHDIEVLRLSIPVMRALRRAGINTIEDLVNKTEYELKALRCIGYVAYTEISKSLDRYNLVLREPYAFEGSDRTIVNLNVSDMTTGYLKGYCIHRTSLLDSKACSSCPYRNVDTSNCMFEPRPRDWRA